MSFFTVGVSHAKVAVEVDEEAIAERLIDQFRGPTTITRLKSPPQEAIYRVRSRKLLVPSSNSTIWFPTKIYASRLADEAEGVDVLVTGPPISVTAVQQRSIEVLRCSPQPDYVHLEHMIKYPLRALLAEHNYVMAHAAGIVVQPAEGVLLLGPRGAGKTTVLMELLSAGLWMLGNDALWLSSDGASVTATAWPHMVRLGEGTIQHNDALRHAQSKSGFTQSEDGKVEVYPSTLEKVFGREVTQKWALVRAVVDVHLTLEAGELRIVQLHGVDAAKVIQSRIELDRFPTGFLPGWKWVEDAEAMSQVCQGLLNCAKVYRLHANPHIRGWGGGCQALLEAIRSIAE